MLFQSLPAYSCVDQVSFEVHKAAKQIEFKAVFKFVIP